MLQNVDHPVAFQFGDAIAAELGEQFPWLLFPVYKYQTDTTSLISVKRRDHLYDPGGITIMVYKNFLILVSTSDNGPRTCRYDYDDPRMFDKLVDNLTSGFAKSLYWAASVV